MKIIKNTKIISSDGWLSKYWGAIFSFGGLCLAIIPWFSDMDILYALILTLIGCFISLIGSYEAKAKQFGYLPPFTNDPLGWRKAKESYKEGVVSEEKGNGEQK